MEATSTLARPRASSKRVACPECSAPIVGTNETERWSERLPTRSASSRRVRATARAGMWSWTVASLAQDSVQRIVEHVEECSGTARFETAVEHRVLCGCAGHGDVRLEGRPRLARGREAEQVCPDRLHVTAHDRARERSVTE